MADLEPKVRGPIDELERESERIVMETMAVIQEKVVGEMIQAQTDWFWEGGGQKQGS